MQIKKYFYYILVSTVSITGTLILFGGNKSNQPEEIQKSKFISAKCPYYMDKNFPKEYFSNVFNEVMVSYPPYLITSNQEITPIKEKFNPLKEPFGGDFYTIPEGAYPWTERKFDVDNDKKDERILSADIAMNHTPNLAVIVKDGFIIFKAKGANIGIMEVGDHNGFFLSEAVDWNIGEYKATRYLYKENKFIPVWYQTSCAVRPQSD